ncbi:hypothetical protein FRACA_3210002 [Frankia canadensis]|uniref:Uncharacterized protein n=1 Tax=Frankia canadensis TaxID=1836972 RepID=A0A2I2KUL7_9ACTN|nr:hypothetical protein FRACA_3210002 [Frankia canadensis]SOU56653.1 hypothetical protein FRACA_3210002 [Frankia canadensis]
MRLLRPFRGGSALDCHDAAADATVERVGAAGDELGGADCASMERVTSGGQAHWPERGPVAVLPSCRRVG